MQAAQAVQVLQVVHTSHEVIKEAKSYKLHTVQHTKNTYPGSEGLPKENKDEDEDEDEAEDKYRWEQVFASANWPKSLVIPKYYALLASITANKQTAEAPPERATYRDPIQQIPKFPMFFVAPSHPP
ncbi:hypothetical protein NHQ30_001994 [Ciborinia camelliae]|nr:hypothetical protein NHQ30_001994 [Ciborinia camelliae]